MTDDPKPLEQRDRCVLCAVDLSNKPARAARNRTPHGLVWVGPVCLACWGGDHAASSTEARG